MEEQEAAAEMAHHYSYKQLRQDIQVEQVQAASSSSWNMGFVDESVAEVAVVIVEHLVQVGGKTQDSHRRQNVLVAVAAAAVVVVVDTSFHTAAVAAAIVGLVERLPRMDLLAVTLASADQQGDTETTSLAHYRATRAASAAQGIAAAVGS